MLTREEIISLLVSIDPNGIWTDEDNISEGYEILTLDEAREYLEVITSRE